MELDETSTSAMAAGTRAEETPVDGRAQDRLWEHRLSVNNDFSQLSNYFLLGQSFLLVVATSKDTFAVSATAVTLLGIALTAVWLYVQTKQRFALELLKRRCAAEFPEYAATRQ